MKFKKFSKNQKNPPTEKRKGFSKKDREQLEEYGSLGNPGEEESEHHSVIGSIEGKSSRVIIDESILELRDAKRRKRFRKGPEVVAPVVSESKAKEGKKKKEEEEKEEEEGDSDWEKPSSYSLLVKSLKVSRPQNSFADSGMKKKEKKEKRGLKDQKKQPVLLGKKRSHKEALDQSEDEEEEEENGDGMPQFDQEDHLFTKLDKLAEEEDSEDGDEAEDARNDRSLQGKERKQMRDDSMGEAEEAEVEDDKDEELTEAEMKEAEEHDEYTIHFGNEFSGDIKESVELFQEGGEKWQSQGFKSESLGNVTVSDILDVEEGDLRHTDNVTLDDFFIKKKLQGEWMAVNKKALPAKKGEVGITDESPFSETQRSLFGYINRYKDCMFPQRTTKNAAELRNLYCLHALNHVFKTRDRVLKNTNKVNSIIQAAAGLQPAEEEERDQGFTRPKVLILTPFRDSALKVVNTLLDLCSSQQKTTVDNKKRFKDEFSEEDEEDNPLKPEEWKDTFQGNIDDCFRVGLKFTRKSVKLFADFYSSDILVASPLGLRIIIGAEGERNRDFDFLSSIEVLIVDQADTILMQNWDHLLHVIDHTNLQPLKNRGADISRIRNWSLDEMGKDVRQTLLFSGTLFPELNALYNRLHNYSGKVKMLRPSEGTISKVVMQVPQVFHRINCKSPLDMDDAKFLYFKEKLLPDLRDPLLSKNTTVFFSSYFEYLRVRNYLREIEMDIANICEYSTNSSITRARTSFFHGHQTIMLYTERFHFFRRPRVRGIRHLIFYGLPENASFYPELLNLVQGDNVTCACLFSKYDRFKLERIVGTERCARMITSEQPTFMFV